MIARLLQEIKEVFAWNELEKQQKIRLCLERAMQSDNVRMWRERLVNRSLEQLSTQCFLIQIRLAEQLDCILLAIHTTVLLLPNASDISVMSIHTHVEIRTIAFTIPGILFTVSHAEHLAHKVHDRIAPCTQPTNDLEGVRKHLFLALANRHPPYDLTLQLKPVTKDVTRRQDVNRARRE